MVDFDVWYREVDHSGNAHEQAVRQAYGADQYIGQNGFSTRDEILALAAATVTMGDARVLDICCGSGGPARLIADQLGCTVIGVDASRAAARQFEDEGDRTFAAVAGDALRLPFQAHSFDAALVLDSLASLASVQDLIKEAARVLRPGGRFGCTAETGTPLSAEERGRFTRSPAPTVLQDREVLDLLVRHGFRVLEVRDTTTSTARIARRLFESLRDDRPAIAAELGPRPVDDLVATLGTLADMLAIGRLREQAFVAERPS